MAFVKNSFVWTLAIILGLLCRNADSYNRLLGNVLTNEIMPRSQPQAMSANIPYCRRGSACGFIQVNAFGINTEQICACPGAFVCPMHWDPEDGQSVTMESQQYKFCGPAPKLATCKKTQPAYSHSVFFDEFTFDVTGVMAKLHCDCLQPRAHIFSKSAENAIENMHVISTLHRCESYPVCSEKEACKEVSISEKTTLVNIKCKCRTGMICPTLSSQAVKNEFKNNFINGNAFSIQCETFY